MTRGLRQSGGGGGGGGGCPAATDAVGWKRCCFVLSVECGTAAAVDKINNMTATSYCEVRSAQVTDNGREGESDG